MKKCPEGMEWDPRTKKCVKCPGGKIRSGGRGRGAGYGKGAGPVGRVAMTESEVAWEDIS